MENEKKEEKEFESHEYIMDTIISQTFARHSKLDEKDYLEQIGFKEANKSEEEAVRIAKFNVLVALTKAILGVEEKFNIATALFKTYMLEEGIEYEEENKEEKGE